MTASSAQRTKLRLAWVGFHEEGIPALRAVLQSGRRIETVLTLTEEAAAKRSGAADYSGICAEFGVPLVSIRNINDAEAIDALKGHSLDVVFVIGWTQIVRRQALRTARIGMVGAHASLLPANRGRAPINWAIIRGFSQTGNSLIWLAEDVDEGDIIDQAPIEISTYDTCATLYSRVAETNAEMILRLLPALERGERPGSKQPITDEPLLAKREPKDGLIDWSRGAREVYDLVRAVTRPYPGAFSSIDGQYWRIWDCALLPNCTPQALPGEVLGPVVSPAADACGQAVACGTGAIVLLEVEDEAGHTLKGRKLSDRQWTAKVWGNG